MVATKNGTNGKVTKKATKKATKKKVAEKPLSFKDVRRMPAPKKSTKNPSATRPNSPALFGKGQEVIEIIESAYSWVSITVCGTSPLVMSRIGEEVRLLLKESYSGKPKPKSKDKRRYFDREFIEAAHICVPNPRPTTDKLLATNINDILFGYPAVALAKATATAAVRFFKGPNMKTLNGMIWVDGPFGGLVPIDGPPPVPVEYIASNYKNELILLNRPTWNEWKITFSLRYLSALISFDQVMTWVAAGGGSVGLGAGRVENGQGRGGYQIVDVCQLGADEAAAKNASLSDHTKRHLARLFDGKK